MATDDPPSPNWLELPREIATTIFLKLGAIEILTTAQEVCTSWRSICEDPAMWRSIDMRTAGVPWETDHDVDAMCRLAVDRSHGGCVDITIDYFGTDELLKYTTERCNHIRRLRLVRCIKISDEGLSEAATKLPWLEVLELSYSSFSKEALETVGQCCPLLKSFKLNSRGYRYPHIECDDEAQAIAKNMHELRHLQLFGNKMTNEGLKAILDGCLHLEYLDLRQCFNVNLGGNLGKICTEQIKDLRRPDDPTDDYEFDAATRKVESSDDGYPPVIFFGCPPVIFFGRPVDRTDDYEFDTATNNVKSSDDDYLSEIFFGRPDDPTDDYLFDAATHNVESSDDGHYLSALSDLDLSDNDNNHEFFD